MSTCECGRTLVPQRRWASLPADERRSLRATHARKEARGLCDTCYRRHRYAGTLVDHERETRPLAEVVEELEHLDLDRSLPVTQRLRLAAPRIGMPFTALEQAWRRAKRKGLVA